MAMFAHDPNEQPCRHRDVRQARPGISWFHDPSVEPRLTKRHIRWLESGPWCARHTTTQCFRPSAFRGGACMKYLLVETACGVKGLGSTSAVDRSCSTSAE